MSKKNKALTWNQAIEAAGALSQADARMPFKARAAQAEAWAKEMEGAPAGPPLVRMGRPSKAGPKVVTELVTFRTDHAEKAALEALAAAQGRSLSDLLRGLTHDLVLTFQAGQKASRTKEPVGGE